MPSSTMETSDARVTIEGVLGVRVEPTDDDGHDFDLVESDAVVGSLRVVDARPPTRPSSYPLVSGAARLSRSWVLHFAPGSEPLAECPRVREQLERLERGGVGHFGVMPGTPGSPGTGPGAGPGEAGVGDALDVLARLGVVQGAGTVMARRPSVVALAPAGVGTSSAHVVNEVVEDEAWRPETRRWAGKIIAGSRHLFVWVDDADLDARVAMEPDVPPEPPILPLELSHVWVARRPEEPGALVADRIWRTSERGGWETLGPVRRPLAAPASLASVSA